MNGSLEIIKNQLAQSHDSYKLCIKQSNSVKKLFVSIWTAIFLGKFAIMSIPSFKVGDLGWVFFGFFIFSFFVLDSIFAMPMRQHRDYQKDVFKKIQGNRIYEIMPVVDFLDQDNNRKKTYIDKLIAYYYHNIAFFYGFFFVLSCIALKLQTGLNVSN